MNNIQNFSKRIRKRIQNSMKRFFTTKASTYECCNSPPTIVFKGDIARQKTNKSHDVMKSYSTAEKRLDRNLKDLSKNFKNNIPFQSGEQISFSDFGQSSTTTKCVSSGIKSQDLTKNISKSKSSLICPTGRHSNSKTDEPCVCINIEQLLYHQMTQVIYEWHKFKSEPTSLDSLKLEFPNTCIQGGQGVVFWVYDSKNNRHFALKMKLRNHKSNGSWLIEQRETKMLKKIQHNFIVNLYHVHETPGAMFMTMEFLDGGCLWSHIAKKGTLPESYTTYYSACILNALNYLHHKSIVYRDLKAENIVLDALGRPKLIDFGMAKKIYQINYFTHKNAGGETESYPATQYYYAAYLAPEIYSRPSSANIYIDSWGLGYFVSEILLGYGVFLSMPWEKHKTDSKDNWKYHYNERLPISNNCKNFLESMLKFYPNSRMSLADAINHPFFHQVHWSTLVYVKPPDLSVFVRREKGSGIMQAVVSEKHRLSSLFEFCDLQLPDPLLTPGSNNQCSTNISAVASPQDTPINPNAPSIRLPILVRKENGNHKRYNRISNNLKYDIYRVLSVQNSHNNKAAIDTISNLRAIKRF